MPPSSDKPSLTPEQWRIVLLIAAVQFVNILDFVIVMPLGPQLAPGLGISEANLGIVNGAYTAAAAIAGLLGAFFLDRFDRRTALAVAVLGLVVGTAAGGFAVSLPTLVAARLLAGAFGGPATSLSFSIISDVIPPHLRGRAMGTVMGAFSVASIVGVPVGLALGEWWSWRAPLFAVAALGAVVLVGAVRALPPLTGHLGRASLPVSQELLGLLKQPLVRRSYVMTAVVMAGGFILIPNIASYLQLNLGLPAEKVKYAYFFGGFASIAATQLGGRLVDAFGSLRVGTFGAATLIAVVYEFFFVPHGTVEPYWVYLGFIGFMLAQGLRNVSYNTLASKVPEPHLRARFQSMQSAVQHGSAAAAAVGSSALLTKVGDGPAAKLLGMPTLALVCMGLAAVLPGLLWVVERGVRRVLPM